MEALILSYGLDTNGQNFRFVKAARKFGSDPRVLSALAIGNVDPGGVVARLQIAASKLGEVEIRSAHRAEQYFHFPNDLLWNRKNEPEIRRLAARADVIHLNNSHMGMRRLRLKKPALLHHHGSLFRNNPPAMFEVAKQHRMVQAVSTPDLLQYGPGLHWLPTAYDVDELQAYGARHRREPDGRIRLVHCPTNRELKHTDLLIASVAKLVKEGLPIDLILVEGVTWDECMKIKATADVLFDQLAFGYGCNAVEAWSMGIPVISGSDPWTSNWMKDNWGETPYEEATPDSLTEKVRQLCDPDYRAMMAAKGHAHVRKYHDEKPALTKLIELYGMALEAHPRKVRIPGKGVMFKSKSGRSVAGFAGSIITFTDGTVEVSDPDDVARLRYLASRPAFGIEEVA